MTETETLQMIFKNFEGRNTTISVADPEPELSSEEVEAVMSSIVTRNVFDTTGGDITAMVRAQIVSRTVNTLAEFS